MVATGMNTGDIEQRLAQGQRARLADEIRQLNKRRLARAERIESVRAIERQLMLSQVADLHRLSELQQQLLAANDQASRDVAACDPPAGARAAHDAIDRAWEAAEARGEVAYVPTGSLDQELQTPDESRRLMRASDGRTIDLGDTQLTHAQLLEYQKTEDLPAFADVE